MKDTTFSSKAYGTHEYKDLTIEGRVQFDVYMALQRDHKLSSYTLNAVSFGLEVSVLHTVPKHLSFEIRCIQECVLSSRCRGWTAGLSVVE